MAKQIEHASLRSSVQLSLKSDLWQSDNEIWVFHNCVQLSLKSDLWQSQVRKVLGK